MHEWPAWQVVARGRLQSQLCTGFAGVGGINSTNGISGTAGSPGPAGKSTFAT